MGVHFRRIICFTALLVILLAPVAHADIEDLTAQTGCSELPSYTGKLKVAQGAYDVFVKLSKRGERATVATYSQSEDQGYGECAALGKIAATGDAWTKAGVFTAESSQNYILQLSSPSLAALPTANRPTILLVPKTNPICTPAKECEVVVAGQQGYVRPVGTLLNQNSLHVLQVVDPTKDKVERVLYYVDDRLAYETTTLKPFDERYISYAGQSLKRTIEYKSGQQVVLESRASSTHQDSFKNFLFRVSEQSPLMTWFLLGGISAAIIGGLLLAFARKVRRIQDERIHHGFAQGSAPGKLQSLQSLKLMRIIEWAIWALIIVITLGFSIVLVNQYALQIITVDGKSMQKTYVTGDQVLINRIPKTLANLGGRDFVPKRGEVVTVHAVFGSAATTKDVTDLQLIKRVIGLPGERVVIKNGILTIYNREFPDGFNPDEGSAWEEKMTPGIKSENIDIQLGLSELFVTGDNRPESIDSRLSGPIKTREVIGVAVAKW